MKKLILLLAAVVACFQFATGQTVILDFESAATSTSFQYFGSNLDGSLNNTVANPNPSGINTSATVGEFVKPADAQVWAGAFSNPDPSTPIDVTAGGAQICINVHMDHIGNLALKLENSTTGGTNWIQQVANTKINEWEQLCFDVSLPAIEAPIAPAAGNSYTRAVLFFDFGANGPAVATTSYFDDLVVTVPAGCGTVLDFEAAPTSTVFQYFGSGLDGSVNNVIANPNPSGINTSAMVGEFVKPADAQVWAGAFSNPNPTTPIDVTADGAQICIKVHMDHIGNLALKLEGSTTGGTNWIQQVSNTKINEWEELCFDVSLPAIEAPIAPAAGHVYERVVLFFDFGANGPGVATTSYFDDLQVCASGVVEPADVTFTVDMNDYAGSFTQVYVSGTFNDWSDVSNPLSDADGDGVWTTTLPIQPGVIEYKFQVDAFTDQEQFLGTETCTVTTDGFTNRTVVVPASGVDIGKVCWNSCYECGESVRITFNLGTSNISVSPDGVFIAGGGNFGIPGDYPLSDTDGDGVYSIVFERPVGFTSFYTLTNGACPDYSCKENIAGQDCANPDNFNDRDMGPITQDTEINTCFGLCTTTTDCGTVEIGSITFNVDMSQYTGSFVNVYLSGSFNGWSADSNPMSDDNFDNIWTTTLDLPQGAYEYKFQLDGWSAQEEFVGGEDCTLTTGGFTNRLIEVTGDATLTAVCFASCEACMTATRDLALVNDLFSIAPTVADQELRVELKRSMGNEAQLHIYNIAGQTVHYRKLEGMGNRTIDTANLPAGMYYLAVRNGLLMDVKKFIIQH